MPLFSHVIEEQIPHGLRLDRYVSEVLRLISRSQIKVRSLQAKINGKNVKLSRQVKHGDHLELFWDDVLPEQMQAHIEPQDIPLDIIYEDDRVIVLNKAQGMVVHPGAGNRQGTMANALYFRKLKKQAQPCSTGLCFTGARPGIVHRLDKETSGVIIAAWDDEALAFLSGQFKARKVKKNYIAIVHGVPKEAQGRIETFITRDGGNRKRFTVSHHGKTALTYYKVLKTWRCHSLVLLFPKTGRTHQLRVHMRCLGHPVLGDAVYGFNDKHFPGVSLMLHAKNLGIILPGETEMRVFKSPTPERFTAMIKQLDKMEMRNEK